MTPGVAQNCFENRVLVTGGSRGIGRAIVEKFLDSGMEVVFTTRTITEEIRQYIASKRDAQSAVKCLELDLADKNQITAVIEREIKEFGGFGIVVHNAAQCSDMPLMLMTDEQWQSVIQISLNSCFYLNKAVLPEMLRKRYGRIIGLVSLSGESGNRGQCNYAAAKGAMISAFKSLSKEVASRGICVNLVSPGLIDTDMTKDLPAMETIKAMIPIGRIGRPEEVAHTVGFLASPLSSYITGEVLRVNGGLLT